MLLAIDVGNTNIVLGVFRLADWELVHSWRLTTLRERTSDELGILVTNLCERHRITPATITGIASQPGRNASSTKGPSAG